MKRLPYMFLAIFFGLALFAAVVYAQTATAYLTGADPADICVGPTTFDFQIDGNSDGHFFLTRRNIKE